jgi:hypothetical protein
MRIDICRSLVWFILIFFLLSPEGTALTTKDSQGHELQHHRSFLCSYRRFMTQQKEAESSVQKERAHSSYSASASFRLGYITDVEGNLDYFLEFVEECQVITANLSRENGNIQSLKLSLVDETCYFVFGGDAGDKGQGDIRLVRALVDLKKSYPSRVFLLVGNRDLNKLRYTAELSEDDMARNLEDIPGPHWDPSAPTLKDYLEAILAKDQGSSLDAVNTRVNRLRYMQEHTLGCPKTFEFRRTELAILQNRNLEDITDQEIVDNFLYEVEQGSLFQYFECANVAVIMGNTLFCHGAVDKDTMQFVPQINTKFENPPSKPSPAKLAETVHEWVECLNDYLKHGLKDYRQRPKWNEERNSRGGESLMALQNRPAMWGRSIISNCYGDGGCITTDHAAEHRNDPQRLAQEERNPLVFEKVSSDPRDPVVAAWLSMHGIQRVVVGHKPTGDSPAVLSSQYTGVEIVSADTSFADTRADDNRGLATSIVEIIGSSNMDNQLHLRGTLQNGMQYSSVFHRLHSENQVDTSQGDSFVGRQVKDGDWWVKVKTDDDLYCFTRGNGRRVEYKFVHESEVTMSHLKDLLNTENEYI